MRINSTVLLMVSICMTVGLTSCLSSSEVDVRKAKQLLGEKKPLEAAVLYSRVADRAGVKADAYAAEAAFEAARIYQYDIKDFEKRFSAIGKSFV